MNIDTQDNDTQDNDTQHNGVALLCWISFMQSVNYAECQLIYCYAEYRYDKRCYECHGAVDEITKVQYVHIINDEKIR